MKISPYAGSASVGGLEGLQPSKNPSFLHQARAWPAPGGEKIFWGDNVSPGPSLRKVSEDLCCTAGIKEGFNAERHTNAELYSNRRAEQSKRKHKRQVVDIRRGWAGLQQVAQRVEEWVGVVAREVRGWFEP